MLRTVLCIDRALSTLSGAHFRGIAACYRRSAHKCRWPKPAFVTAALLVAIDVSAGRDTGKQKHALTDNERQELKGYDLYLHCASGASLQGLASQQGSLAHSSGDPQSHSSPSSMMPLPHKAGVVFAEDTVAAASWTDMT